MKTHNWQDTFKAESKERQAIDPDKLCKFGIGHLDDALYGILPNDLVVIGADSGVGKSEVGLTMAQVNAKAGKRVLLYFLEGGNIEAMARIKWRDITRVYFEKHSKEGIDLDYRKWRMNAYNEEDTATFKLIDAEIYKDYAINFNENLKIYELTSGFDIDGLLSSLIDFYNFDRAMFEDGSLKAGFGLDLIIIDHLQYFDLTQGENEIQTTTKILKEVKKIADMYKIPVVLISHLRKKTKDRGLPDQEDFYGSSNIPKIASMAITIAPDKENFNLSEGIYPTFFRIVKSRTGISSNFAIKCDFHSRTRMYSDKYDLYRVNNFNAVDSEPLTEYEKPEWARMKGKNVKRDTEFNRE